MSDLNDWITREGIEELAGRTIFERGEAYFAGGVVGRLHDIGYKVSARVHGTETYRVELWADEDELGYDCTCPHAAEGNFCKHCVALALAWLDEPRTIDASAAPEDREMPKRRDPWAELRDYLLFQPTETLADWLLDAARRDDALYRTLTLKAERAGGSVDTVKAFRRAIDSATRIRGYIDYEEAGSFAEELDQLADSLEELLEPESAALLVDLAEYAIERVEQAQQQVADEEGEVYGVLERLGGLHLDACGMAKPDPVSLAERLFRYEVEGASDAFYNCLRNYHEILGPSGLQRYRELAEQAWSRVKPLGPRDKGAYESGRLRITGIMEALAELSGDLDTRVAIKARDLTSAHHYLEIAKLYREANQPDKALDWAEQGLKAFPDPTADPLRDFIAAAYLERGRGDEALQLTWVQFEKQPKLEQYQKLHQVSERLGVWPAQRERALAELDAATLRAANATSAWKPRPSQPDRSERVRIALWENDLEAAWQAAQQGVCRQDLRLSLARQLEASRPADAVTLYRRLIPALVEQTNNNAYEEAAKLIRRMGGLMETLDQANEFGDYLAELWEQYKPKRNFIKLLDSIRRTR
jgi:uncharacterized Zn finger protein